MPRYIDGSGEDQKYFDQVQRATAGQVNRDAGLMSPREAAGALFNAGVTGAATSQQMSNENYRSLELIEYSPEPIPLISSQFIFNRTLNPAMVANPVAYRAYAESLFGGGLTLAGGINSGVSFKPPPVLPILPYTNSAVIDATNSLYDGTSRLIPSAPIVLFDSQLGVQSSSTYPYGIGFRVTWTTSRLWTLTMQYYTDAGVLTIRNIVNNNVLNFTNGQTYDGVLTMTRASQSLPNTNIDIFLKMRSACSFQPAGFDALPAGFPNQFNNAVLGLNPQLIWDAV